MVAEQKLIRIYSELLRAAWKLTEKQTQFPTANVKRHEQNTKLHTSIKFHPTHLIHTFCQF